MKIEVVVAILVAFGGFVTWLIGWVKWMIKSEIESYDKRVKDEKLHDLQIKYDKLVEFVEKSKQ